jgi:hypothetical protein
MHTTYHPEKGDKIYESVAHIPYCVGEITEVFSGSVFTFYNPYVIVSPTENMPPAWVSTKVDRDEIWWDSNFHGWRFTDLGRAQFDKGLPQIDKDICKFSQQDEAGF